MDHRCRHTSAVAFKPMKPSLHVFGHSVHPSSHFVVTCECAAPLVESDTPPVAPRPFDLFAAMKSSAVGGVMELRKMYVCFGYMFAFDLQKWGHGCTLQEVIKPASCFLLAVQIKCFGGGFGKRSVESFGPKGKVPVEEGLPIVAVDLNTTDSFRVRRTDGVSPLIAAPDPCTSTCTWRTIHICDVDAE